MLVLEQMEEDLKAFISETYTTITWKTVYDLFWRILSKLYSIHEAKFVHKDLHSGNVLHRFDGAWFLADLGFCGPVGEPVESVYGNLPYMAPEVIRGKT